MGTKHLLHVAEKTDPLMVCTDQQRLFISFIVKGDPTKLAAQKAGYKMPEKQGHQTLRKPRVQAALHFAYQKYAKAAQITRKKVMDGLLESIEMAKIQSDPGVMVAGWREIGKMCGFYAPEVKKIDISITTKRVVDQLETLTDDDLLKLVDEGSQVIEGEATEVLNELDYARAASEPDEAPRTAA